MGRKSTVPDGWVSLYSLIREARETGDTELAADVCDWAGIVPERRGPHGTLAIRAADVPTWRAWHDLWTRRFGRRRRRKRRDDAAADPPRRLRWRPPE